jgi:hypothetical protein
MLRQMRGKWQYRFQLHGHRVVVGTGLAATERNRKKAEQLEAAHRQAILDGRFGYRPLTPRSFTEALAEFMTWLETEYEKESTRRRIETSMASCSVFFGKQTVSMIDAG